MRKINVYRHGEHQQPLSDLALQFATLTTALASAATCKALDADRYQPAVYEYRTAVGNDPVWAVGSEPARP